MGYNVYTANRASRPVVSTVAPTELYDILTEDPTPDSSGLARRTIEYQLKSYAEYISAPPKYSDTLPSLVDLAARKLPDALDALDDIPDVILSRHLWNWHTLSYPTFRSALTRLASEFKEPPTKRQKHATEPTATSHIREDIDEWILSHEKFLGDNERLGSDWRRGLITMETVDAVFPTSTLTEEARKITRPTHLAGFSMLDARRPHFIAIQPSVAAFRRAFERMSNGLLKSLDWRNIFVAGGIVLGTLLALDAAPGQPSPAADWSSSDIDVYIYGLSPAAANAKIRQLFFTFRANLPPRTPTFVVRNSKTITFYARYPLRRIQIVLKLVKSPRAVLLNFDLDICAMGWDGSELWMLPRAARALETGFNVFTMNLVQGHYLSERRASQEQRVFKYATKGYGIRILPSYIVSLEASKKRLGEIAKDEDLFSLDMGAIAMASRTWTNTVVGEGKWRRATFSHIDLENRHQTSSEPLDRSCLTGFSLFMRHVELWEMEQRGEVVINEEQWAATDYNENGVLAYDDTPHYTWGIAFNIADFQLNIDRFNLSQIVDWLEKDHRFPELHNISDDGEEFTSAARVTYGHTAAKVLERGNDIVMAVLLPCNFAAFANRLVGEAQAAAGLRMQKILWPAVPSQQHLVVDSESTDTTRGIFLWRIGNELMWQQLDRRIDETFEALYAFYRANDRTHGGWEDVRLVTQLSKRAIRPTVEDEYAAFARWVGRRPIFVDRFYNRAVELDKIGGQGPEYDDDE